MSTGSDTISLALTLIVLFAALGLRVWLGKKAWAFHPEGYKGYLRDEAVNMLSLLIPAVVIGLGLRYQAMRSGPNDQSLWLFMALGVVLVLLFVRRGVKYIPFLRGAAERIQNARRAVYTEGKGASS